MPGDGRRGGRVAIALIAASSISGRSSQDTGLASRDH